MIVSRDKAGPDVGRRYGDDFGGPAVLANFGIVKQSLDFCSFSVPRYHGFIQSARIYASQTIRMANVRDLLASDFGRRPRITPRP